MENLNDAIERKIKKILEEFRSECQSQYIAFEMAHFACQQSPQYSVIRNSQNDSPSDIYFGRSNREDALPTAKTSIREFLEWLNPGGKFEDLYAKAVICFIYSLWEEKFRKNIADLLSIELDNVACDLMGDVRKIRHAILHDHDKTRQELENFQILPESWKKLRFSIDMIRWLIHQINNISIGIDNLSISIEPIRLKPSKGDLFIVD